MSDYSKLYAVICEILTQIKTVPFLVDVGASKEAPPVWQPLAPYSYYLGFDPDSRETTDEQIEGFKEAKIYKSAVGKKDENNAKLYLTEFPFCSSLLKPNEDALKDYMFAPFFLVNSVETTQTESLGTVCDKLNIPCVHWLKSDSQGADLQVFKGLDKERRNHVLALDLEPGLIDAYCGEDKFTQVHEYLCKKGFWLSDCTVHGSYRVKTSTMARLKKDADVDADAFYNHIKRAPGWVELRYLRSLESMVENEASMEDYCLLWVFAAIDGHVGFCMDVYYYLEKQAVDKVLLEIMKDYGISCLCPQPELQSPLRRLLKKLKLLI